MSTQAEEPAVLTEELLQFTFSFFRREASLGHHVPFSISELQQQFAVSRPRDAQLVKPEQWAAVEETLKTSHDRIKVIDLKRENITKYKFIGSRDDIKNATDIVQHVQSYGLTGVPRSYFDDAYVDVLADIEKLAAEGTILFIRDKADPRKERLYPKTHRILPSEDLIAAWELCEKKLPGDDVIATQFAQYGLPRMTRYSLTEKKEERPAKRRRGLFLRQKYQNVHLGLPPEQQKEQEERERKKKAEDERKARKEQQKTKKFFPGSFQRRHKET
jgi:hypothetical protein